MKDLMIHGISRRISSCWLHIFLCLGSDATWNDDVSCNMILELTHQALTNDDLCDLWFGCENSHLKNAAFPLRASTCDCISRSVQHRSKYNPHAISIPFHSSHIHQSMGPPSGVSNIIQRIQTILQQAEGYGGACGKRRRPRASRRRSRDPRPHRAPRPTEICRDLGMAIGWILGRGSLLGGCSQGFSMIFSRNTSRIGESIGNIWEYLLFLCSF